MACINPFQTCNLFKLACYTTAPNKICGGKGSSPIFKCQASTFSDGTLRLELDENPEGIISGEWAENFSLLSYDDLRAYLESQDGVRTHDQSAVPLSEVMSRPVRTVMMDQTLEEADCHFEAVSGLPVVDPELRCVGMISKGDKARASHRSDVKIGEVMTSPAITLSAEKTVIDAAALMLRMKIRRIPIVNKQCQVIGIVTRTDVLRGLEALLKI